MFMMYAFHKLGCVDEVRLHHAGRRHRCAYVAPRGSGGKRPAHGRGRPPVSLTAATALRITSVTTCGCESMITWEPSTSVILAPACRAMARMTSLPAALSPVATTAQAGKLFQAGTPEGSENAPSATGRWVAAMRAACSAERSAAKASWKRAGLTANSTAVLVPWSVGYLSGTWALLRTLSFEPLSTSP